MIKRGTLIACVLLLYSSLLNAQDITMDLGGQNHQGVYNTRPLREFSKVIGKTELRVKGWRI